MNRVKSKKFNGSVKLLFLGAKVILACRDVTKAERAAASIRSSSGNKNVTVKKLDLSSMNSVRSFSKHILETETHIDVLINNAGTFYTKGSVSLER